MRIGIDATPAVRQHAGVGRYARELIRSMVAINVDHEFALLCAAAADSSNRFVQDLPPGAKRRLCRLSVSDRVATAAWQRLRAPVNVERFTGSLDLYHGTDFVVPPSRCPSVVTIHDLSYALAPEYADPRLVSYLRAAATRSIRRADRVITVSAAMAADAATVYPWARDKVVAIPNGVRTPPSAGPRSAVGRPTILCVGTIEPRKNHLGLVAAMNTVRGVHEDAQLIIAGRVGWLADDIEQRLREEASAGRLRLVNSPTDIELEALYASASIAVLPSFYEGFGLPVLEAMARRIPVIASDIPAHREIAGTVARFVDPYDVEDMGTAITEILNDSARLVHMASEGFHRASAFNWDETARRTLRTYESAVAEGA
jgi:glycosyltransferase involved in cell wall biosynthesis